MTTIQTAAIVADADRLVLGASNALLEAIALGLPVVAFPGAGNAADVLGHGRFGIVAPPRDLVAWTAALLRQTGSEPVRAGDRVDSCRRVRTMAAWRAPVTREVGVRKADRPRAGGRP